MAPEQMRNAVAASDRSDVYGLGALLFELAAGRRAYTASNPAELIVQVLSQDAPFFDLCPDAPPELSTLLARMLRREPPDRPMMVEALRELVLIHSGVTAHAALRSGAIVALDPRRERLRRPPSRSSRRALSETRPASRSYRQQVVSQPAQPPASFGINHQPDERSDGRLAPPAASSSEGG